MLSTLRRLLATDVRPLHERIERLEHAEVERAAEHAAQLDRLERLYKRISARIAREEGSDTSRRSIVDPEATSTGESPLTLRRRIRG